MTVIQAQPLVTAASLLTTSQAEEADYEDSEFNDELTSEIDAQPLELASGLLPNTGIKVIPTTGKFQENNQRSLADGNLIGGSGNGEYQIYPATKPVDDIPYIKPTDADGSPAIERPVGKIVYTNGISTSPKVAAEQAQLLADMTNNNVRVVYSNADTKKSAILVMNPLATDPAVLTISKQIQDAFASNKPFHLYGHSGGAATIRNALVNAKAQLRKEMGYNNTLDYSNKSGKYQQNSNNKAIDAKIEARLKVIKVETSGSPVGEWKVDGPEYVHWVNDGDPVIAASTIMANGAAYGGKNSVTVHFLSKSYADGAKGHELDRYLNVRDDQGGFYKIYAANKDKSGTGRPVSINVGYPVWKG
jgi:hypothetical protein